MCNQIMVPVRNILKISILESVHLGLSGLKSYMISNFRGSGDVPVQIFFPNKISSFGSRSKYSIGCSGSGTGSFCYGFSPCFEYYPHRYNFVSCFLCDQSVCVRTSI